jgi:hypothetical protein
MGGYNSMSSQKETRKKNAVRILALALAAIMVISTVIAAVLSNVW